MVFSLDNISGVAMKFIPILAGAAGFFAGPNFVGKITQGLFKKFKMGDEPVKGLSLKNLVDAVIMFVLATLPMKFLGGSGDSKASGGFAFIGMLLTWFLIGIGVRLVVKGILGKDFFLSIKGQVSKE